MGPTPRREEQERHSLLHPSNQQEGHRQTSQEQIGEPYSANNYVGLRGFARETWLESKRLWHVAGPSIFTRLAMFSLTVITQSFAGHLSDLDLAAISIVTTVFIAVSFGFLLGMASSLETLCGQAYGAKQYHLLGMYLQRSWIVLFLCSILMLPMFLFAGPMLKLIGQSIELAEQTGVVATWLIPLHLSFQFQFTLQQFLQSQLKTWVIVWVSAVALVIHVLISWAFVYEMRVGVVGTCMTLDFSWWVSVLGMFGYCVCGWCPLSWTGFSTQAFVGLWDFFKLSLASGVMLFITIYVWESMIPLGFLAAAGVRIANELGAGNAKGAKFATTVSVSTSLVVGLIFWLIIMAFPEKLATIFTSNVSIIEMVDKFSILLALTILLNCIQPTLSGVAVGLGWQALVAFINILSYYVVGVTSAFLCGWLLDFSLSGIWGGMLSGSVVQTLVLIIVTRKCAWEKEAEKAQTQATTEAVI